MMRKLLSVALIVVAMAACSCGNAEEEAKYRAAATKCLDALASVPPVIAHLSSGDKFSPEHLTEYSTALPQLLGAVAQLKTRFEKAPWGQRASYSAITAAAEHYEQCRTAWSQIPSLEQITAMPAADAEGHPVQVRAQERRGQAMRQIEQDWIEAERLTAEARKSLDQGK